MRPRNLQTSLTLPLPCFSIVFSRLRTAPPATGLLAGRQWNLGAMLESSGGFDPPLDLVHLARQCLGDHELEAELLGLFRLQARALTAELSDGPALSLESKAKIAHKIRGSALAVGARRVASAARMLEELASRKSERAPNCARNRLASVRARRGRRRNRAHSRPETTAGDKSAAANSRSLSQRRTALGPAPCAPLLLSPRLLYEGAPIRLKRRITPAAPPFFPRKNSFRCPN